MSIVSSQLCVVTAVSNPLGTVSRPKLAKAFIQHMRESGVYTVVVEAVMGHRDYELAAEAGPRVLHVPVRHGTICWHKESLLNIGVAHAPRQYQYIAWIDSDVTFRSPTWGDDTVDALQQFPIVQPWDQCLDLGPHGEVLKTHTSLGALHRRKLPVLTTFAPRYEAAHPGYAWAARRGILDAVGGLYDLAVLGAADRNMAMAILGRVRETFYKSITPQMAQSLTAWEALALKAIGGRLGYVQGVIEHSWHGPKAKRGYVSRPQILGKHGYDPVQDTRRNTDHVIELAGNKPSLQHDIELYFDSRLDDANVNI